MHKSQVFLYLLLAFIFGILFASLSSLNQFWLVFLILISISLISVFTYQKTFSKKGLLIGFIVLSFSLGIIRFGYFDASKSVIDQFADIQVNGKNIPVIINGYIWDEPEINKSKASYNFYAKEIVVSSRIIKIDDRILISIYYLPVYQIGQKLSLYGALEKPQNFSDFDYISYLKKQGMRVVMPFPKVASLDSLNLGFWERIKISSKKLIFKIKDKFEESVSRSMPEPNASFINGILLGSRQNIPDDLKNNFNKTSTTHILAISGYNITIIADVIMGLLLRFMKRKKAFWLSVFFIFIFTILTGASASVIRAAIMGLLILFAMGYGRLYDVENGIILAAAIMIFFNPFLLGFDVGFQLSFLAVAGLVYIYPILEMKTKRWLKFGIIKETLLMSLSAQILVFPLLIYDFHQLSFVSLPTNLFVLPFVPYAMFFGFMTGIGGLIYSGLGRLFGFLAWIITEYQIKIIDFFGNLNFSSINIYMHWITVLVIYIIIFGLIFYSKYKNKKRREALCN